MKAILLLFSVTLLNVNIQAQGVWNTKDIQPAEEYENIHVKKLDSDSLGTAFLIWVKNHVAMHHHAKHTESVYILEGEGEMTLGSELFKVKTGDFIFIPMGKLHGLTVTSETPMKAISIQAPEFLGKDRIYAGQLRKE